MKLRSGREIKEHSLEFNSSSKQYFSITPFMVFSGMMGMYAGLLAFVFVNSSYYPYCNTKLNYFISESKEVLTNEFNDMIFFYNLMYTKWSLYFSNIISKYLTIIVNHLVMELYGMDTMYCLANTTIV